MGEGYALRSGASEIKSARAPFTFAEAQSKGCERRRWVVFDRESGKKSFFVIFLGRGDEERKWPKEREWFGFFRILRRAVGGSG